MAELAAAALGEATEASRTYDVTVQGDAWVGDAARSLVDNGFVALHPMESAGDEIIPASLCDACAEAATRQLDVVRARLGEKGIDPVSDTFAYSEVCKRHSGARFDLALDSASWSALAREVERWCLPVLARAGLETAKRDRVGCVVSLPNAPDQSMHVDGAVEGLVNAFVPLVAVGLDNGTEVVPGSHAPLDFAFVELPAAPPCTPVLSAGSIMLLDYRTRHRGLANRTAQIRPLGYVVFAAAGKHDANFPVDKPLLS